MSAKRILIVDANASRRQQHAFGLRCAGFAVEETTDPPSARLQIARRFPNLLLICVALLDGGVQSFVQGLRDSAETSELPIAVLAERGRRSDAKHAHECGLDDFITQPISPEEFVARVSAAAHERGGAAADATTFAGLRFDEERCVVRRGQRFRVGMVFQKPTPFPMSIFENVAFGIRLAQRLRRMEIAERVEQALRDDYVTGRFG